MRKIRVVFVATAFATVGLFNTAAPAAAADCGDLSAACAVVGVACEKVTKKPCFY